MGNTKALEGKVIVPVYSKAKGGGCPLDFRDLVTYSHLSRCDTGQSKAAVARFLGLGENGMKVIFDKLQQVGIAINNGGTWSAVQPPAGWFRPRENPSGQWFKGYVYWPYYLASPDSPLTTYQNAAHSLILSFGKPVTRAAVAKILGVDRATVESAVPLLAKYGLVHAEAFLVWAVDVPEEKSIWWRDREVMMTPEKKPPEKSISDGMTVEMRNDLKTHPENGVYWMMKFDCGYTDAEIRSIKKMGMYPETLQRFLWQAENDHDSEKFKVSSAKLLIAKIRSYLADCKLKREEADLLMAVGTDAVFARQIEAFGKKNDMRFSRNGVAGHP